MSLVETYGGLRFANPPYMLTEKTSELSQAQFESFRRILGNDFRPLQDLNGRAVRTTHEKPSHKYDKDD